MTSLHTEDASTPTGGFQLWIRAGCVDDPEGASGTAHALEHLVFYSGEGRNDPALEVERWGGWSNGDTDYDWTRYELFVDSARLLLAASTFCRRIARPGFREEVLVGEKKVIQEEIRMYSATIPHVEAFDKAYALVFRRLGYRNSGLGSPASVRALTLDGLRSYHRRHYVPGNMVAVSVGAFPQEALEKALLAAFPGARRRAPAPLEVPNEPPQRGVRVDLLRSWATEPRLTLAFRTAPFLHPDAPGLELLLRLLSKGSAPLVGQAVVEATGAAPSLTGEHELFRLSGAMRVLVEAGGTKKEVPALVAAALKGVARAQQRLAPHALDDLKRALLIEGLLDRETVARRTYWQGFFETIAGDHRLERSFFEAIVRITPAELQELARRYLRPDRLTLVLQLPRGWVGSATEKQKWLETLRRAAALPAATDGTAPVLPPWATPLPPERAPRARARGSRRPASAGLRWKEVSLPCGARLVTMRRTATPTVALAASFPGGLRFERRGMEGASELLADTLTAGARGVTPRELRRRVQATGSEIATASGGNTLSLQGVFAGSHWRDGLGALLDCALEPTFPAPTVARARLATLQALEYLDDNILGLTATLFSHRFYRVHPYGYDPLGTKESLSRLTRAHLARLHAELYPPSRLNLAVVGNIDPGEVEEVVAARLRKMKRKATPMPLVPQEEPRTAFAWTFDPIATDVVRFFWGFAAPPSTDPHWPSLLLMEKVLGYQSGRLFTEIRERRGLDYSPNIFLSQAIDPAHLAVSISCVPARSLEAIQALTAVLRSAFEEPATKDELAVAKAFVLAADTAQGYETNEAIARFLAINLSCGRTAAWMASLPARIEALTSDGVQGQARRIFDARRSLLVIVGPEEVRSQAAELAAVAATLVP
ncbi:MAG: insulinase family protein [Deltaproteobacteria bacterium]|nr:insulinase family protein [Deltaproteobacteria bacterium]